MGAIHISVRSIMVRTARLNVFTDPVENSVSHYVTDPKYLNSYID